MKYGRIQRYAPYAILALLIVILFSDFFIHGYVLDGNKDRRDHCFPFHLISQHAFQQATIPQWNPYIFCGSSFWFSSVNLFFYPPNWILYCFPPQHLADLLTVSMMVHMFLAGVFAFVFCSGSARIVFGPCAGRWPTSCRPL